VGRRRWVNVKATWYKRAKAMSGALLETAAGPAGGATLGRLASVPLTLLGLVLVTFLIGHALPIDPILAQVGDHAPPEVVARVRAELGLDQPLYAQFAIYLQRLARGELGTSTMTQRPVLSDIARFFPATLELATAALILALLAGIPLGVWAAARPGSALDRLVRVVSLVGQSIPVFVLGLLLLLLFYARLGWAPGTGQIGVLYAGSVPPRTGLLVIDAALARQWAACASALAHLALPALTLALFTLATITRMTRGFMRDTLASDFILAARAKGLSERRILWRHAFATIAVPLITVVALAYAGLLEGAVLTETVFSWPGLGLYFSVSLLNADMNAVLGATLVVGVTYVALNLVADLLYRLFDPRVG
jgi:peptide/nickel transport system permease protein